MHRHHAGATLVELLIVVSITAAGASAFLWRTEALRSRLALRQAAVGLLSDLRVMQSRAIGERSLDRAYGLQLPVGADRYALVVREGVSVSPLRVRVLPPRVRITYARFGGGMPTQVLFTGVSLFGAPSGGGTVTFSSGGIRLCVRVAPATGRARVSNRECP